LTLLPPTGTYYRSLRFRRWVGRTGEHIGPGRQAHRPGAHRRAPGIRRPSIPRQWCTTTANEALAGRFRIAEWREGTTCGDLRPVVYSVPRWPAGGGMISPHESLKLSQQSARSVGPNWFGSDDRLPMTVSETRWSTWSPAPTAAIAPM